MQLWLKFGFLLLAQMVMARSDVKNCGYTTIDTESSDSFHVMTFNTWTAGHYVSNGLQKIINHIKLVNPDILALQEIPTNAVFKVMLQMLGENWSGVTKADKYPDTAIVTRHKISLKSIVYTKAGLGADIYMSQLNKTISFWCLHLDYKSYGPYAANNKLVVSYYQIGAGESGRLSDIMDLLTNKNFQRAIATAEDKPVIVAGDFNSPSHLDWIESTRSIHGDWSVNWPATVCLQDTTNLIDSYRELHPNVLQYPGITWSSVEKMTTQGWNYTIPEPQDRIDFIFYSNTTITATVSITYGGYRPIKPRPYHKHNDYPSDHFAVITSFTCRRKRIC